MNAPRGTRASVFPLSISLGLLVVGCASGPPAPRGPLELPEEWTVYFRSDAAPSRTVIGAPIDRLGELVPGVYQHLGLGAARATNTGEYLFITPNLRIEGELYAGERNSDYIDCGRGIHGLRADLYRVEFAMFTRLRPGPDGGTTVETLMGGVARAREMNSGTIHCRGTGKLETMIADLLRVRSSGPMADTA